LKEGIDLYRSIGAVTEVPLMTMLLAGALVKAGRLDAATEAIETALTGFDGSPLFCDAELPRWKGEIYLAKGSAEQAEPFFRTALENARRQQAKSLELHVSLGLGRIMAAQGCRAEARELIDSHYSWFSEGLNTADLISARCLMDSLS
jgi:ATP/maltotriose-dependent transcriptional regulator MalT